MDPPNTVMLTGEGVSQGIVGGKGAWLDRLIARSAPVPPVGVITAQAYHRFVRSCSDLSRLLDELRSSPPPAPEHVEGQTRRVEEAFLEAPMPQRLEAEILELAGTVGGDGQLAIRSSATAEDMSSASFAGQYRSFLDVSTTEGILESVRLVWSSLWFPAPRAYRRFRGIDETDLAMAVVVMRLVDARLAGVVFTVDPGGREGAVRLESVEGLGEKLVSGEVTPTAYVVPRSRPRRDLAQAPPVLGEVIDLALRIEGWFGAPQDVEWAYDGDRLFVVQARPITTAPVEVGDDDGFDTEPMASATYTPAGVGEMVPGMLPPLLWTTAGALLEEGFRELFDRLGAVPEALAVPHGAIGRFRGRVALNLDLLKLFASELPGGSSSELERQYFGRVISDPADGRPRNSRGRKANGPRALLQATREIRARAHFAREADVVIESVDMILDGRVDVRGLPNHELIRYRHRLLDVAGRAIAAEIAVAAAAAAAYRGIELFLEGRLPEGDVSLWTQRLTSGGIHTCGGHMAFAVCELVTDALTSDALAAVLTTASDPGEVRTRLAGSAAGRRLLERFDELLGRGGSASVFGGPTWAEQQGLVWQVLRQAIDAGHIVCPGCREPAARCACGTQAIAGRRVPGDRIAALDELEDLLMKTAAWRATRIMTGQVVDVRRRILRRMVADAVAFLDRRERAKTAVLRLGGEVRRVHVEMAERLAARGAIGSVEDVAYLSSVEIDAAFDDAGPSHEAVAERRRRHDQARSAGPLPQLFVGRPPAAETRRVTGDSFVGWAGSPGRHRARAVVIHDPSERLDRGRILVARTTDPSWTPLFLAAGAIVIEEGGPLSHAAIVARELKLPAVLNIPGIVDRLDGAEHEVTVDGTSGTVTIHRGRAAIDEVAA